MQPTSAADLVHRLAGVIWGDAKTGKTTWAMSLPGRKLLINFDPDGFLSVAHRNDFDLLDFSLLPAGEQIEQAKKAASFIVQQKDTYQSVIVDSVTNIVAASITDAINRGVGKSATFTPSIDAPGLAAWGARNSHTMDVITRILRATGQNKQHCFFIAHADDPEYAQDGKSIIRQTMMLSAKVRNPLGLNVSEIYYVGLASGNRRTVYTAPHGVLTPMGSRIFDTTKVPKFELPYSIEKPDEEQPTSLVKIFDAFKAKRSKLTEVPK